MDHDIQTLNNTENYERKSAKSGSVSLNYSIPERIKTGVTISLQLNRIN